MEFSVLVLLSISDARTGFSPIGTGRKQKLFLPSDKTQPSRAACAQLRVMGVPPHGDQKGWAACGSRCI